MKTSAVVLLLFAGTPSSGWAARCTTVLDARTLPEYNHYIENAEQSMMARFARGDLSWIPEDARKEAVARLEAGQVVRRNLSDTSINQRLADWNGTIVDWIGAIRIRDTRLEEFREGMPDYGRYSTIYQPLVFESRATPVEATVGKSYDVTFGLLNTYRTKLFSLHYSFEVNFRTDHTQAGEGTNRVEVIHSRSDRIRESASGTPGRNDLLEQYHDHGVMWALNTYWHARQSGPDLYVEFESVTLARSVKVFACKIGIFPVPKAIISDVMEALPSESLELMLTATKSEFERRAARPPSKTSR
jgi:hypothetical protein